MEQIAQQLKEITAHYARSLCTVSEEKYSFKPLPQKWSKKEILGHLIDSAQNNIRRFIVAQHEEAPVIVYRQNDWVVLTDYQHRDTHDLIELWRLLNAHASIVLSKMGPASALRTCGVNGPEPPTVEWLAADYIKHLLHHLHQILDLEPVDYP